MRLTNTKESDGRGQLAAIRRFPAPWALAASIGALLFVFNLDRASGSAPVQHLYYLPIIFAGVRFGKRGGAAAAVGATVLFHLANPLLLTYQYEESDAVAIALFVAAGITAAKLTGDAAQLRHLAMTDDLTGLHNLRSFEARLTPMVRAARAAGTPLAMLVLDVDKLKSLNDRHGHLAGAEAVRMIGHIIADRLPEEAVACRYGGDEFAAAIPRCEPSRANEIADGIRQAVHDSAPVLAGIDFPAATLSISIGIASLPGGPVVAGGSEDNAGEALFRAADAALYEAKAGGRNHVSVA